MEISQAGAKEGTGLKTRPTALESPETQGQEKRKAHWVTQQTGKVRQEHMG